MGSAAGLAQSNKPLAQSSKASGFFSANNPAPRTVGATPVPNPPACKAAYQERQQAGCLFSYRFKSPMPRFYFDVSIGSASSHDEAGYEIDSLHAAEIEARRSAGELTRDRLLRAQSATSEDIRVEVKDEHRQHVLTVTVSIRVDHEAPTPPLRM